MFVFGLIISLKKSANFTYCTQMKLTLLSILHF